MSLRTETAYKAEPQGESAQHDEAHPDLWGMVNAAVMQGKIMLLPGEICPTLRPPVVVAPHVVMHGVIGQKSADGIVVDSQQRKRRPEAKRENFASCSILSMARPVHVRVDRRGGEYGIFKVSQNVSPWLLI